MHQLFLSIINVQRNKTSFYYKLSGPKGKMSSGIKFSEAVKTFDGSGDVEAWIMKLEMVLKVQKAKKVEETIPLLLEGDALSMFMEMKEEEKRSADKIKELLREPFGENPFSAYKKLCSIRWTGEPVDVFMNNLRKTARAAGVCGSTLLKRAFISGFPERISKELRAMEEIENCEIETVVGTTKAITNTEIIDEVGAISKFKRKMSYRQQKVRGGNISCYACGGYFRRDCWEASLVCFSCGRRGHINRVCPKSNQGNWEQGAIAPEMVFQ